MIRLIDVVEHGFTASRTVRCPSCLSYAIILHSNDLFSGTHCQRKPVEVREYLDPIETPCPFVYLLVATLLRCLCDSAFGQSTRG